MAHEVDYIPIHPHLYLGAIWFARIVGAGIAFIFFRWFYKLITSRSEPGQGTTCPHHEGTCDRVKNLEIGQQHLRDRQMDKAVIEDSIKDIEVKIDNMSDKMSDKFDSFLDRIQPLFVDIEVIKKKLNL